jgi:tetratricopeptide (TPR) repeat protein
LGKVSVRLRQVEAAREYYDRALKLRQELFEADKLSVKAKQDMAVTFWAIGDLELQLGNARSALENYQAAHKFRDALYQEDRDSSEMQWDLSGSLYRLGNACLALGQTSDAEDNYQDCMRFREQVAEKDPSNTLKQIDLMLSRARCGQHEEASRIAAELLDRSYPNPGTLFSIACGYSLCVSAVGWGKASDSLTPDEQTLQQRYTERAIENLQQAIARGYKDLMAIETDPDLVPLRERAAYKELVQKP